MDLKDELLADLKPFLIAQCLKRWDMIEEWVNLKAQESETPFDDYIAGMILSYAKGLLLENA